MKLYTTLKVGYTRSIYGCSGEYFTTVIVDANGIKSISYYGLYGSDQRIGEALKAKGYEYKYTPNDYGLMKSRTVWKGFIPENEALQLINDNVLDDL